MPVPEQEAFNTGQKVHVLLGSGVPSAKRFEIVKVWRYRTTFRYLLDTGYVADHSELRASTDGDGQPRLARGQAEVA
jgi:hypothetical protein